MNIWWDTALWLLVLWLGALVFQIADLGTAWFDVRTARTGSGQLTRRRAHEIFWVTPLAALVALLLAFGIDLGVGMVLGQGWMLAGGVLLSLAVVVGVATLTVVGLVALLTRDVQTYALLRYRVTEAKSHKVTKADVDGWRNQLAAIDARLQSAPTAPLAGLRAAIARDIVGDEAAYRGLEPWLTGPHPASLDATASAAASGFDPALALKHAEAAAGAAPGDADARVARLAALMACGRSGEALPGLDAHLATTPGDQYALALRYVAWRVVGDPRALSADDYRRLTAAFDLAGPIGQDREAWLAEATAGLRALHPFRAQPLGQSIRSGVQAALDPRFAGDPAIDAIFGALTDPIERYIGSMAGRDDPMSRRAGGGFEIIGSWSVRLTAGGRHSDHIHPNGWVSSALYVQTPELSPNQPRAGWLRFGACRLGIGLELAPEHWIEPKPGRVALFPSWMWHGTEPFTGGGERLTVAFDVQPR